MSSIPVVDWIKALPKARLAGNGVSGLLRLVRGTADEGWFFHRAVLSGFFIQIVVVKYSKENDPFVPVRGARALVCFGVNRDSVTLIDPNRPRSRVIDDPFKVKPRMEGVFLKKGQSLEYLPLHDAV